MIAYHTHGHFDNFREELDDRLLPYCEEGLAQPAAALLHRNRHGYAAGRTLPGDHAAQEDRIRLVARRGRLHLVFPARSSERRFADQAGLHLRAMHVVSQDRPGPELDVGEHGLRCGVSQSLLRRHEHRYVRAARCSVRQADRTRSRIVLSSSSWDATAMEST